MKLIVRVASLCITVFLVACSAALVPETSDPSTKVGYVRELMNQDRILPAERMLREVHQVTPVTANEFVARGEAHVLYAVLLGNQDWMHARAFSELLASVGGEANLPVAVSHHLVLAANDYASARDLFSKQNDYFSLSNIEWRLAGVYVREHKVGQACESLDASLRYSERATQENPNMKPTMYGRYSSYSEMISAQKRELQCS